MYKKVKTLCLKNFRNQKLNTFMLNELLKLETLYFFAYKKLLISVLNDKIT